MIAGAISYARLGREEDPDFTIKMMVVSASMPGATIDETLNQVTKRIERELEQLEGLDFTNSVTMPGTSVVYVQLLSTVHADQVEDRWTRVRFMLSDIAHEFPPEFQGFQFNDNFGDVFGNIYAFTSDGFTPREMHDRVEDIRKRIHALPAAGRTELLGTRDERVYLEFSSARLASLGVNQSQVIQTLAMQNAISPSGVVEAGEERVLIRVSGQFDDAESIAAVNLRIGDRFFNLSDVATVRHTYSDPPEKLFRYNGQEAIGLQVGMAEGGNILTFGRDLDRLMARISAELPIGIEMVKFADQPAIVQQAVGHFVQALTEAVVIVLAVSFITLGLRAGLVVTLTIPLVLAITFVVMDYFSITLQRVSLGALIISLGLLVDDAMIAIETMISRLERGDSLEKSASYAWTSIAFPMLTGTLVTVAGFIPIGLNSSMAGEFTFSLFVVIAVSLIVSWIVAVLFTPLLGASLLTTGISRHDQQPGRLRRGFHKILTLSMRFKWLTITGTLVVFVLSIWGMRFVEQQFFPNSDRTELVLDITSPANASISKTDAAIQRLEKFIREQPEPMYWTSYIGQGTPRFVLALDVLTPGPQMGQIVIQNPDLKSRDQLRRKITDFASTNLIGTDVYIKNLEVGPPVGKPVQYRISGSDIAVTRDAARDLAALLSDDPRLRDITLDWNEPARMIRLQVNQDKARQLGVSVEDISSALAAVFSGRPITQMRDNDHLISVIARGDDADRHSLAALYNLQLATPSGSPIPLAALATLDYGTEQPLIMQRNGRPTVTVKAAIATKDQPATLVASLESLIDGFAASLPPGLDIQVGGTVENSADSQKPIVAVVPVMLLAMAFLVMMQMQSFRMSLIVFAAAPLGLIGVVAALLPFGVPLGFVAILGILALVGILIRNSVILMHEVQVLLEAGHSPWQSIFWASDSRARPILLTAAAASLALIPISRQVFWGPMAFAMMGGIIAGTLITLVFVPALYCAIYGVTPPKDAEADPSLGTNNA